MKGFFYPDAHHEDPQQIKAFCKALSTLNHRGVRVVFLEFLYETVPNTESELGEHFKACSGGRHGMAEHYIQIVKKARKLGMKVFGLSRQEYSSLRSIPETVAYRMMGPFDGVAASVIQRNATTEPFVVFLGRGHWPLLKYFIPALEAAVTCDEPPLELAACRNGVGYLPEMIEMADRCSSRFYSSNVVKLHPEDENRRVIDSLLEQREMALQELMSTFENEVRRPLTIIQLNYLISKRKQLGSQHTVRWNLKIGRRIRPSAGVVRIWDLETGQCIRKYSAPGLPKIFIKKMTGGSSEAAEMRELWLAFDCVAEVLLVDDPTWFRLQ